MRIQEKEIAWAAGLFVGEGNAGISRSWKAHGLFYDYLLLQMGMYDERAVRDFAWITNVSVHAFWLKERQHMFYRAHAVGRRAERAFALMWPYLENTDKGDQVLYQADRLAVTDWVTGVETGKRPQRHDHHRGKKKE